jgi:hypothetical protein
LAKLAETMAQQDLDVRSLCSIEHHGQQEEEEAEHLLKAFAKSHREYDFSDEYLDEMSFHQLCRIILALVGDDDANSSTTQSLESSESSESSSSTESLGPVGTPEELSDTQDLDIEPPSPEY